jgi:hypothetical protein
MEVFMSRLRIVVQVGFAITIMCLVATSVVAQPFALTVRKDRLFGAGEGTLVFTTDNVTYETTDVEDAREWGYDDLKQIQVVSPTRVVMVTYEGQSWIKFGADRTFDFEVTGEPVSDELVAFLLERVPLPLVIATVSAPDPTSLVSVPVKLRQGGSHGTLELQDNQLVYRTNDDDRARVWRLADLHLVFQPDRHRLTVQAYEGGGDQTRTFEFDIKRPLPEGALEEIWAGMHGPSWPRVGRRD